MAKSPTLSVVVNSSESLSPSVTSSSDGLFLPVASSPLTVPPIALQESSSNINTPIGSTTGGPTSSTGVSPTYKDLELLPNNNNDTVTSPHKPPPPPPSGVTTGTVATVTAPTTTTTTTTPGFPTAAVASTTIAGPSATTLPTPSIPLTPTPAPGIGSIAYAPMMGLSPVPATSALLPPSNVTPLTMSPGTVLKPPPVGLTNLGGNIVAGGGGGLGAVGGSFGGGVGGVGGGGGGLGSGGSGGGGGVIGGGVGSSSSTPIIVGGVLTEATSAISPAAAAATATTATSTATSSSSIIASTTATTTVTTSTTTPVTATIPSPHFQRSDSVKFRPATGGAPRSPHQPIGHSTPPRASRRVPSLKLKRLNVAAAARAERVDKTEATMPCLPQNNPNPSITITIDSDDESVYSDYLSPEINYKSDARVQFIGDDTSLYGTPKEELLPCREENVTVENTKSSPTTFLKDQIYSFFQPSDNKLAMKLFGNKNALYKEKMRHKRVGNWVIHPCSNFRLQDYLSIYLSIYLSVIYRIYKH
ncbi:HCN2 [Acanthosepion pharaonis]|uniref:HCN2 n=1 Tax=Acanthosepion pharaonis TaxID=158019 RepID=A0A812D7Y4_ACAPH|nr:HCN2 [Sepia pharaonis]